MTKEERLELLDKAYQYRKLAQVTAKIESAIGLSQLESQSSITRAEEIEASILTPLPEPELNADGDLEPMVELMTVADFIDQVKHGCFNDYDGSGYYATATHGSRLAAIPSEIAHGKINNEFTHVAWYNK